MKDSNTEVRKSVNQLKKLFAYCPEKSETIPADKLVGYMDRTNILMVIPKTYFFKSILTQDFDVTKSKIPEISYNNNGGGSNYSVDLINLILPLLKNTAGEKVYIETGKDFPITLETEEVKILFAPMVSNE